MSHIVSDKNSDLLKLYKLMFTARMLDDIAARYTKKGMGWSYHARCGGHEPIQIAFGSAFTANKDYLFSYYRDLALCLTAGISPYEIILNGLSKDSDVASGGRHMSNHFAKPEIGIQNVSSCTGNHTLHAVGLARAVKYYNSKAIVFCSQGEASSSEGYCYEAYSGAVREKLPVIFLIQNNGYGISVPVSQQSANPCVADNYKGLKDFCIIKCDGTDIFDSKEAVQAATKYVREHQKPVMIHADCIRMAGHSNADANKLYISEAEIANLQKKDPLLKFEKYLLKNNLCSKNQLENIKNKINAQLEKDSIKAQEQINPLPSSVADFSHPKTYEVDVTLEGKKSSNEKEKLREAINRTLFEEFERNKDTFLWGQDVASKNKGGVFNLTKGLLQKFGPDRIFNGPLCEDYIVGTANGMSRYNKDIRIVIEASQFADYIWPAMEQIVEMGHEYWRTKGKFCPNIVLRVASGGYITGGLYHSQNIEAIMSHLPGFRVVYPAFADDAAGLLRTAIRSDGPTFFLEPKYLYNRKEAVGPKYDAEHCIAFGRAKVRVVGSDLTIITYGNTAHMACIVAGYLKKLGFGIEVVDLRTIKPLDVDTICASVRKTSKALVVHEDHGFAGVGAEVVSTIVDNCFNYLDAPVKRLVAKDVPIGFAKSLETITLPQICTIEKAALELLRI